jgi:co-chaperonin GroES (HSP10)
MITPIREQILVKPLPTSKVSKGGIIAADSYVQTSNKLVVIKTGRGTQKRPMEYQPNDIVFRIKNSGVEIEENGEKFYLIDSMNILAYVRN